ncbi:MAG: hypothetical protein WA817_16510 [Candidatus Acidiferrum sp.]
MDTVLEREIENASQEAASLKSLREKFLLLAEGGDRTAMQHVAELEKREATVRERIKQLHFNRLPLAQA